MLTTNTFGRNIYNGIIPLKEDDKEQSDFLVEVLSFRKRVKPKNPQKKRKKKDVLENFFFFEDRDRVLNAFDGKLYPTKVEGKDFSDKVSDYSNLKILTPKQMLQRLDHAHVKASNTSGDLLNEIRPVIYPL